VQVLVTGGTGFVGSHAVRALREAGHELRLLVRSPEKLTRVFGPEPPGDVVEGDITDPDSVAKALAGVDAVVHSAAVVAIEAHRAQEMLRTNRRGVELVVGGACERGVRSIVYVSSMGAIFTPGTGPIRDDSPVAWADSAYGRSKADGEMLVRELQEAGGPIRTIYPAAVVGPEDPGLSEANHALVVYLRDTMVRTSSGFELIDVRDLAAVIAALAGPELPPGRYIPPGHFHAWPDLIDLMDELTGRRVRRLPVPGPALRVLGVLGDLVKRVLPFDFPLTSEAMHFATQWPGTVPSPALVDLDLSYRDARETYCETIRWLHRGGHLTAEQAGKLAG